jgi:hypothetical protein
LEHLSIVGAFLIVSNGYKKGFLIRKLSNGCGEHWVMRRTAVVNQIRSLLLERGLTLPNGRSYVDQALPDILEDACRQSKPRETTKSMVYAGARGTLALNRQHPNRDVRPGRQTCCSVLGPSRLMPACLGCAKSPFL